jgi:seryl-tRNA synthetase
MKLKTSIGKFFSSLRNPTNKTDVTEEKAKSKKLKKNIIVYPVSKESETDKKIQNLINSSSDLNESAKSMQKMIVKASDNHADQIDFMLDNIRNVVSKINTSIANLEYTQKQTHNQINLLLKNNSILRTNIKYLGQKIDMIQAKRQPEKPITTNKTYISKCKYCGEEFVRTTNANKFCPSKKGIKNYCRIQMNKSNTAKTTNKSKNK